MRIPHLMSMKLTLFKYPISFLLFIQVSICFSQSYERGKLDPRWKTNTSKRVVEISEFTSLMPRDGFEVFNNPEFIEKEEYESYYFRFEPVISLVIEGEARAYPLNVLTYHEIANDIIKGIPVAVTYCPLCNSGVVFDRRFTANNNSYVFDFGVSGMLRKSDMVMWDKQTETWWQQLTGEGLVGELSGEMLSFIPSQIISIEEFFDAYPDGKIMMSHQLEKYGEAYGANPYDKYDSLGTGVNSRFFKEDASDRLPPMERIIEIGNGGQYKIYPFSTISKRKVINDSFYGKNIVIFYTGKTVSVLDEKNISESSHIGTATVFSSVVKGEVLNFKKKGNIFIDTKTKSKWDITGKCLEGKYIGSQLVREVHSNHFAFAWLSFHPDSEIYE